MRKHVALSFLLLAAAGCSRPTTREPEAKVTEPAPPAATEPTPPTADPNQVFRVRFDTSKGPFIVEVHRDWAPIGAQRFEQLVKAKYYDGARFFRIVPNFVVQFGLAANPAMTKKWDKPIDDDPVKQTNRVGSLSFATAGPNTRTAQVFINLRSNQRLDGMGFAPFGIIVEGMNVVEQLYPGYGELPDQDAITRSGNAYLEERFPKLDYIKTARIL